MSNAKKKIKDYLSLSMRKLKHRKGYGVHSPFAYSIITEVIEEKLPYYAYHRMARTYGKDAPISMKVACLMLRLANRFRCRNVAELSCNGGYTILPLVLTDSRLRVSSLATPDMHEATQLRLMWLTSRMQQVNWVEEIDALSSAAPYDMIVINDNPFLPVAGKPTPEQLQTAGQQLADWVMTHSQPDTLIFVKGIQPRHRQELFWDQICDREDVSITMDLYDYGLAILKPHFFKQHYIVAF